MCGKLEGERAVSVLIAELERMGLASAEVLNGARLG